MGPSSEKGIGNGVVNRRSGISIRTRPKASGTRVGGNKGKSMGRGGNSSKTRGKIFAHKKFATTANSRQKHNEGKLIRALGKRGAEKKQQNGSGQLGGIQRSGMVQEGLHRKRERLGRLRA